MKRTHRNAILLFIALISLAMHFRHFSKDLVSIHVWRQTQTQSTIINFYEGDMNIFNPARNERGNGDGIFRMEFPLMQWLVAVTYKVLGNHLIITRIFMFVIGLFSIAGIYKLLSAIFRNDILALIGAWAFNFSPSFFYYTINPLPDNLALCCSIWGIALFFMWIRNAKLSTLLFSGLFLILGALCKLPFILYFITPLGWLVMAGIQHGISGKRFLKMSSILLFLLPPLAWYATVVPQWDVKGIVHWMSGNDIPMATILDYLQFNIISTLPELLLNYGSLLFFLVGFFFLVKNNAYRKPFFPLLALPGLAICGYFLYELNMIANVHDYYLFPFLPFLFILVAYGANQMLKQRNKVARYLAIGLLLILPLTAYLRMQVRWSVDSPGFNKDLLTYKHDLQRAVPKNALCIVGNDESHHIFFYYLDKKGWGFDHDGLVAANLKQMIGQGAAYLYSDSRIVDGNKEIEPYLDHLIMVRGTVKVYSLKK
ncbi:MAG: glycosyltransferase family 39 protein [Bacteroidota bacterium]